jgi:hypothetical protein
MYLTRAKAEEITQVVAADPHCIQLMLKGFWGGGVLSEMGWAGGARNASLMLTGADPSDPEVAQFVCTGIANATASVIRKAIQSGQLQGVSDVGTVDREPGPSVSIYHTATLVELPGGKAVFDWHATLQPANPKISSLTDWKIAGPGENLRSFQGL